MALFSEHRFYMKQETQQKYFSNSIADTKIPSLSDIEDCIYAREFERAGPDDTFLQTTAHTFIDFIPISLNDGGLQVLQEFNYQIRFAFSLSNLDCLFNLKTFINRLEAFKIEWFFIVGDLDFDSSLELFKTEKERKTGRTTFYAPVSTRIIYSCFDNDVEEHISDLISYFDEIVIISDKISLDQTFIDHNVDGNYIFTTRNFHLINNYPIRIIS